MTDPTAPPTDAERRLTEALTAVAERQPVVYDFDALQRGADAHVVALHLPPRANRLRTRLVAAAAVVIVLLAVGAVVATRSGDDAPAEVAVGRDEGTGGRTEGATDPPGPEATGWYLPAADAGWELTEVVTVPTFSSPSIARAASFAGPTRGGEEPVQMSATVVLVDDPAAALASAGGDDVPRGEGGDARTYRVEEVGSTDATVLAALDDRVLLLSGTVGVENLLAVADRWWASGGAELAAPPDVDVTRIEDSTWSDAHPVAGADPLVPEPGAPVTTVRLGFRDATGTQAYLDLQQPGVDGVPTGVEAPDRGAGAGLAAGEQPELTDLDAPGPVWVVAGHGPLGRFPGADVEVLVEGTTGADPDGPETRLLAVLRPVTGAEWADAIRAVVDDPDPALLAPTLAGPPGADEEEVAPDTTPDAPVEPSGPTAAHATADALIAFALEPSDAAFAAIPLADAVDVGLPGGEPTARADLRRPEAWVIVTEYSRHSPLDQVSRYGTDPVITDLTVTTPAAADAPACVGDPGAGATDPSLVVIEPVRAEGTSCHDWFQVTLTLDAEARITAISLRLWEM